MIANSLAVIFPQLSHREGGSLVGGRPRATLRGMGEMAEGVAVTLVAGCRLDESTRIGSTEVSWKTTAAIQASEYGVLEGSGERGGKRQETVNAADG